MISCNPKGWLRFHLNIHKTDTVRKVYPLLVGMALYTYGVANLELAYFRLSEKRV